MTHPNTAVLDSIEAHFKYLGWSKEDIEHGITWTALTVLALRTFDLPMTSAKYPEVLRALANGMDIVRAEEMKNL